jgi:SpoVK/Ycf46/Vps4 family AAA+-type ATPase
MECAMATAQQIKALLKSYAEGDDERFITVSLQLAAHAARKGQGKLAEDLRKLVDEAQARHSGVSSTRLVPIARATGELSDLLAVSFPKVRLVDLVLPIATRQQLGRIILEYRQQYKLRPHGLSARRKLLLVGAPGSGKTMTASALAGELKMPLLAVQLHAVITKFMGETAAKLSLVFGTMHKTRGVYLFDEFDAIGGRRTLPNDVGEIRRVLNSFLQFLEQDESDSLIIAATNHRDLLDKALFRRFDDVLAFELPTAELTGELLTNRLNVFGVQSLDWQAVLPAAAGLSFAELARACDDAARTAVLDHQSSIQTITLVQALEDRRKISQG